MPDLQDTIASHPFVRGMKPEHLKILADSAIEVSFPEGELIFREGDAANRFYLVTEGEIAVESHAKDSPPVLIQRLGDGEVLGWSWLFPPYYWNFDARAIKPTRAIFFYGTRLRERCEEDRDFGYELMKRMSQVMLQRLHLTRREMLKRSPRA